MSPTVFRDGSFRFFFFSREEMRMHIHVQSTDVPDDRWVGEVVDRDGRAVVLLTKIWEDKILRDHPELVGYLAAVLGAVAQPDHVEPDGLADRVRFYRREVGPSRWLLVVVSFEQEPARIITALANRKDPKLWKP